MALKRKLCKCALGNFEGVCTNGKSASWLLTTTHEPNMKLDYSKADTSRLCLAYCAENGECKFGRRCRYVHPQSVDDLRKQMIDCVKKILETFLTRDPTSVIIGHFCGSTFDSQVRIIAAPHRNFAPNFWDLDLVCPHWLKNSCDKSPCGAQHRNDFDWENKWSKLLQDKKFRENVYSKAEKYQQMAEIDRRHQQVRKFAPDTCSANLNDLLRNFNRETKFAHVFERVWKCGAQRVAERMVVFLDEVSERHLKEYEILQRIEARAELKAQKKSGYVNADKLDRMLDRCARR